MDGAGAVAGLLLAWLDGRCTGSSICEPPGKCIVLHLSELQWRKGGVDLREEKFEEGLRRDKVVRKLVAENALVGTSGALVVVCRDLRWELSEHQMPLLR